LVRGAALEVSGEAEPARQRGALGVGLYRTEFLYLEAHREPTEEDHYQAYREVLSGSNDRIILKP